MVICYDILNVFLIARVLVSHGSSALQKGHRRALSGCLPSAVGAVAWSSLRDLDTVSHPSHFTAVAVVRTEGEFYYIFCHAIKTL